ncbi:MAG: histidine phosphatase family protein [Longimicrobiales bacterium]
MTSGFRYNLLAVALVVASVLTTLAPTSAWAQSPEVASEPGVPVVVYLVRHAEKADDGTQDPPLTVAGQIRVQTLKAILADAALTEVHSTDLARTRETARPIAEDAALGVSLYDPTDLPGFAEQLKNSGGRHLVSGHSNTTPDLVAALGGDPGTGIDEMEYDRLYILVIPATGPVVTNLLRFGEPYVAGQDFGMRSTSVPRTPPWGPDLLQSPPGL